MDLSRFKLLLPLKAEFVSVARLTGSGIANRAGFDFDAIEDIKVVLSEVCNSLINDNENRNEKDSGDRNGSESDYSGNGNGSASGDREMAVEPQNKDITLIIDFTVSNDSLTVDFAVDSPGTWTPSINTDDEDEYGLMIAQILMDEFEVNPRDGCVVSMVKYIAEIE